MTTVTLTIQHSAGLHARPAALFVKTASAYPCTITLRHLGKPDKPPVNAKSVLGVLTLGVNPHSQIEIAATGEREDEAVEALKQLIENNFGEAV